MPDKIHLCGEDHRDMTHLSGVSDLVFSEQSSGSEVVLALEFSFDDNLATAVSALNEGKTYGSKRSPIDPIKTLSTNGLASEQIALLQ